MRNKSMLDINVDLMVYKLNDTCILAKCNIYGYTSFALKAHIMDIVLHNLYTNRLFKKKLSNKKTK